MMLSRNRPCLALTLATCVAATVFVACSDETTPLTIPPNDGEQLWWETMSVIAPTPTTSSVTTTTIVPPATTASPTPSADSTPESSSTTTTSKAVTTPTTLPTKPVVVRLPSDVLFDPGDSDLTDDAKAAVHDLAVFLLAHPGAYMVTCHTDDVGDDAYNTTLSVARARSVADALSGERVSDVSIDGKGETMPIADNTTPTGRALNRRCEATQAASSLPS